MPLLNTADALYMADREASHAFLGANRVFTNLELAIQKLFAAGEQGVWFDNSDLGTLYQDSGGGTSAVVNGLIGLQLDKAHADGRGVINLLPHSNVFDAASWGKWNSTLTPAAVVGPGDVGPMYALTDDTTNSYHTVYTANGAPTDGLLYARSVVVKRGTARYVAFGVASTLGASASNTWVFDFDTASFTATGSAGVGQTIEALGSNTYRITWVNISTSSFNSRASIGTSSGPAYNDASYAGTGALTVYVAKAQVERGSASTTYQANGAVVGGPGNHRYQTTTAAKPILRGTPVGPTLLTNGDYALDAAGWTLIDGTASFAGAGASRKVTLTNGASRAVLYQAFSTTPGRIYRVRLASIDNGTSGASAAQLRVSNTSGFPGTWLSVIALTTSLDAWFTATATTTYVSLGNAVTTAGLTVTFGAVDLHDVSADAVQAPYRIQYDGVDDFLRTENVDFTSTSKMTVWAGVRKAGGTTNFQTACSLWNGTSGMAFYAPNVSGPNYAFYLTTLTTDRTFRWTPLNYPPPITNVVTGLLDVVGATVQDEVGIRVDGAAVVTLGNPNMTSVTAFVNAALFFGRENGTSLPFNGGEFQMIIRGAQSSTSQIEDGEILTAQRTGVTLP